MTRDNTIKSVFLVTEEESRILGVGQNTVLLENFIYLPWKGLAWAVQGGLSKWSVLDCSQRWWVARGKVNLDISFKNIFMCISFLKLVLLHLCRFD